MNPSLSDYRILVHMDVPEIDVIWTGTAAAVANAIFNATGKRVRKLPITLDKLM